MDQLGEHAVGPTAVDLPQTPKHRQLGICHPHVILGEVKGQKYTVMATIKSSLLTVVFSQKEKEGREDGREWRRKGGIREVRKGGSGGGEEGRR